ncbi:hypothetical protein [Chitinibacter sp. S2-10]|uniref:hypothetical protein n=1 Tax=Chitinibacter sp. S2-10 TaxID=3373597 RepID=UPI003977859A
MIRQLIMVCALLQLTGCATLPGGKMLATSGKQALQAAPVQATLTEAQSQPLPLVPTQVQLGKLDPAYLFGTSDKAFFKLYRLPVFKEIYSVTISTRQEGLMGDSMLLLPNVLMLDEAFKVKRSFNENKLRNRGSGVELTVFINPSNADEHYMLIRNGNLESSLKQNMPIVQTNFISTPYGTFMITNGSEISSEIHSSPVGMLNIEQHGLTEK